MKLQDVLHYYLGCPMYTNEGIGKLATVYAPGQEDAFEVAFEQGHPTDGKLDGGIPILRPMDSMTKEEMQLFVDIKTQNAKMHWLFQNFFDVFGLIDTNEAVSWEGYEQHFR